MILNSAKDIKYGSLAVERVYQGSNIIWEKTMLPSGYQRCKWLSSNDDAYLITNFYPKIGDAFVLYLATDSLRSYDAPIYATNPDNDSHQLAVLLGYGASYYKYFTEGAATSISTGIYSSYMGTEIKKMEIKSNSDLILYDGRIITGEEDKFKQELNAPLYLFERTNHSSHFSGKIGTVAATRNNTAVLNLIPCLDNSGVPCMYDTVSQTSFYNQGTGEFGYELA